MKKLLQLFLAVMMITCVAFAIACDEEPADTTCEHDYVETVVAATCTTAGRKDFECSKCHDKYSEAGDAALGHEFKEENYVEKTAATCIAAQVLSCKCTRCNETDEKNGTAALGHDVVYTTVTEPTCTAAGVKNGKCSRCEYEEKDVAIKALGHNYELSADLSVPPTCTEEGKDVEVCSRCNDKIETAIPANGHTDDGTKEDIVAPTCTDKGTTTRHCSECGNDYIASYDPELGHEMELTDTIEVSCLTDGYNLWVCKRENCDHKEKRDVTARLNHVIDVDGNCTSGCGKNVLTDYITWFDSFVDFAQVSKDSFDFTAPGGVETSIFDFNVAALDYLAQKGYDAIRMTFYGKNGAAIDMSLKNNGAWLAGWTGNKAPLKGEVKIETLKENPNVISYYAPKDGIDGFNVTFKPINTATIYENVEEWFTAAVPCTKVGDNSFDFTVAGDAEAGILDFNGAALDYLTQKGYDKIRMTYYGKNGAAINMSLKNNGPWLGFTNNVAPKTVEIEISTLKANPNIVVFYVAADGIDGFNVTFKPINTALIYETAEGWFTAAVPCTKVGDNSFDFTVAGDAEAGVLDFNGAALDYLTQKGYDKIRMTYYGKNGAAINMSLKNNGPWLGFTSNEAPKTVEIEISTLKANPNIVVFYVAADGIDGFNVTFEAINTALIYETAEGWFTAAVPCTKVGDNSFDFTVAGGAEASVLDFNGAALDYLTQKGYSKIRMTYYGKNGAAINMSLKNNGEWLGYTDNVAPKTVEIAISELKANPNIVVYYVPADGIDGFNVTFEAIEA